MSEDSLCAVCVCSVVGVFSGLRDEADCGQVVSTKRLVRKVGSRLPLSPQPREGQRMRAGPLTRNPGAPGRSVGAPILSALPPHLLSFRFKLTPALPGVRAPSSMPPPCSPSGQPWAGSVACVIRTTLRSCGAELGDGPQGRWQDFPIPDPKPSPGPSPAALRGQHMAGPQEASPRLRIWGAALRREFFHGLLASGQRGNCWQL